MAVRALIEQVSLEPNCFAADSHFWLVNAQGPWRKGFDEAARYISQTIALAPAHTENQSLPPTLVKRDNKASRLWWAIKRLVSVPVT